MFIHRMKSNLASLFLSFFLLLACEFTFSYADFSTTTSDATHPSATATEDIFSTPAVPSLGLAQNPSVYEPYRGDKCGGYNAIQVSEYEKGVLAILQLNGDPCYAYGTDYPFLALNVSFDSTDRLHVSIQDLYGAQFQFSKRTDVWDAPLYHFQPQFGDRTYNFSFNSQPFEFWVTRVSDGEVLFDTRGHKLIFEDQYIELTTNMVDDYNVYGLAETVHGLRLGNNLTRTFWANGNPTPLDRNAYGTHPFYLEHRYTPSENLNSDGQPSYTSSTHGVLMLTANGMEVLLRPNYLQYRIIGGIVDLYIYVGGTKNPKDTVSQFVQSVGTPAMQQHWTFGFHICRWGYKNVFDLVEVKENFKNFEIPVDTFWSDIDYMYEYRDFTVESNAFPKDKMMEFFNSLQQSNQHYVPIIDAAIYAANPINRSDDVYYPYYEGVRRDIFLRNPDRSLYVGNVWPGFTTFPDFTNPETTNYWTECLMNLSAAFGYNSSFPLPYSGLWIDMNEPTSFCIGSCGTDKLDQNPVHPAFILEGEPNNMVYMYPEGFEHTNASEHASAYQASVSQYYATATSTVESVKATSTPLNVRPKYNINYPPYALNTEQGEGDLSNLGVSVNATYHDGTVRYNLFNTYGYDQSRVTYDSLTSIEPNVRPFILSRSTFVGSGKYAAHWLGDNYSLWSNMIFSIPGALTFNMVGLPMVGADVCGFMGNTDEELCSRWMALGAFLPFYRNHNSLGSISQEPYRWESVAESSRRAMNIRYSLLPYWYTLMYEASSQGLPLIRPLFFEFPNEPSLANADRQFMVGSALLVTPVLEPNVDYVRGVFPGDNSTIWYDWYDHKVIYRQHNENITLSAPLTHINVAIRGGNIIPMQKPSLTTHETKQNPYDLLVALDSDRKACGSLYVDDGVSIQQESTLFVKFVANGDSLSIESYGDLQIHEPLSKITIIGLPCAPIGVYFEGVQVESFSYLEDTKELVLTNLEAFTSTGAFSNNWTISWNLPV